MGAQLQQPVLQIPSAQGNKGNLSSQQPSDGSANAPVSLKRSIASSLRKSILISLLSSAVLTSIPHFARIRSSEGTELEAKARVENTQDDISEFLGKLPLPSTESALFSFHYQLSSGDELQIPIQQFNRDAPGIIAENGFEKAKARFSTLVGYGLKADSIYVVMSMFVSPGLDGSQVSRNLAENCRKDAQEQLTRLFKKDGIGNFRFSPMKQGEWPAVSPSVIKRLQSLSHEYNIRANTVQEAFDALLALAERKKNKGLRTELDQLFESSRFARLVVSVWARQQLPVDAPLYLLFIPIPWIRRRVKSSQIPKDTSRIIKGSGGETMVPSKEDKQWLAQHTAKMQKEEEEAFKELGPVIEEYKGKLMPFIERYNNAKTEPDLEKVETGEEQIRKEIRARYSSEQVGKIWRYIGIADELREASMSAYERITREPEPTRNWKR